MHANGISNILSDLGIYHNVFDKNVQCSCLFANYRSGHKSGVDNKPSMGILISPGEKSVVNCFACGYKNTFFNTIKEYGKLKSINVHNILKKILDAEQVTLESILAQLEELNKKEEAPAPLILDEDVLEQFTLCGSHYLLNRGVSLKAQEKWGVRKDEKYNRVVFPVRNTSNELVGAVGRLIIDSSNMPKYYNYWEFPKKKFLFGEQFVRTDKIVIVEGIIDTILLYDILENTEYSVLGSMGSILSREQIEVVVSLANEAYIFPDNDPPGITAARKNGKALMGRIKTNFVQYNQEEFGEDPASLVNKNINIIKRLDDATVLNFSRL